MACRMDGLNCTTDGSAATVRGAVQLVHAARHGVPVCTRTCVLAPPSYTRGARWQQRSPLFVCLAEPSPARAAPAHRLSARDDWRPAPAAQARAPLGDSALGQETRPPPRPELDDFQTKTNKPKNDLRAKLAVGHGGGHHCQGQQGAVNTGYAHSHVFVFHTVPSGQGQRSGSRTWDWAHWAVR